MQVFSVGVRVAGEQRRREDEGRCPAELHRLFLAHRLVQAAAGLGTEQAEPPRLGQLVIRCEPGQVEQIADDGVVDGRTPELLVRPPRADGGLDVHGPATYRSGSMAGPDESRR